MKGMCHSCRWWSEMISQAVGTTIQAICLNKDSQRFGEYTNSRDNCPMYKAGPPVDKDC